MSILYFVIALVSFRSSLINKGSEDKAELVLNALAPSILMAVILLDTCVPYRSELDGALMGQQSRGMYYERPVDQGLTGEGEKGEKKSKKPMIEEPRSLASRALFTYMNPVSLPSSHCRFSSVPCIRDEGRRLTALQSVRPSSLLVPFTGHLQILLDLHHRCRRPLASRGRPFCRRCWGLARVPREGEARAWSRAGGGYEVGRGQLGMEAHGLLQGLLLASGCTSLLLSFHLNRLHPVRTER